MSENIVIDVRDLSFGYSDFMLMDHVSFQVRQGDFAAVIGSNGTGKSTMIKLLLGLLTPTGGDICLFGKPLTGIRNFPEVGYVPQNSGSLASSFPATAEEIVMSGLYSQIGFLRPARKRHHALALDALESVGMRSHASSLMSELSGGQQQRIMLAKVLVNQPKILLLDEPTVGIDAQAVLALLEILHHLNIEKNVTIVMVTHDLAAATPFLSRVFCLSGHNFAENRIPEGVLVHAHPPEKKPVHRHIHCAACEEGPHNSADCDACIHMDETGVRQDV